MNNLKRKLSLTGKEQGNNYSDIHLTPVETALDVIYTFKPEGKICEPCRGKDGSGGFWQTGIFTEWFEVDDGRNFFDNTEYYDWIITNPPYSILTQFLNLSLMYADNVVFAPVKVQKLFSKTMTYLPIYHNKGLKELIFIECPPEPFPQTGFQYVYAHWQKGYSGSINVIRKMDDTKRKNKLNKHVAQNTAKEYTYVR